MAEIPGARAAYLDEVLARYDLDVVDVAAVRVTNNAVFRLNTTADSYALRIHRADYRLPQQIRSELSYVEALAEGSEVMVPRPVRTRGGDLVAALEVGGDVRYASVVAWLDGEVRRPGRGAGRATLFGIGQALGRIHQFSAGFNPPDGFDLPTWDIGTMFSPERLRLIEAASYRSQVDWLIGRAQERFGELTATPQTYGVLHHDFILLNCLHSHRQTAVIDFDDSGWGFYLQDLGGLLGNLKDYNNYRTLREWFVEGYESVRRFPTTSERDMELMIALRHCTSLLWLLERHAAGAMPTEQFERNLVYRIEEIESSLVDLTL
ncbi:MAG: phosphotransferase enzyme family protein [Acidimicrobiia bacterium]